jgi:hypothetical protein
MIPAEQLTWQSAFTPPDRRQIWEWAHENVWIPDNGVFSKGANAFFDVAESRHFIQPLEWLWSPYIREVNILKPVRSGGTLIADVFLPSCIRRDPGPWLAVFQENDIAKEHCELRVWPILESDPHIAAMIGLLDKDMARTQQIIFPHMPVIYSGPSINKLQSKGFRYLICDEPWLYEKGKLAEAKGRTGDFEKLRIEKKLFISQGGATTDVSIRYNADWFNQYNSGEINEWNVQCLSCGRYQIPRWNGKRPDKSRWGIRWDAAQDERGMWMIAKAVASVRFECFHCGFVHIDGARTKSEWNRTGRYAIVGEPNERKKSAHWPGTIDTPWADMLEDWLTAKNVALHGDKTLSVKFLQKRLAAFEDPDLEEEFDALPTVEISLPDRNDQRQPIIWTDETTGEQIEFIHRHLMVDVSLRRLWVVASAWSDRGDDLTLEAREIPAEPSGRLRYEEVEAMQARWQILDQDVGWDVNYEERAQEVIEEIVKHGHFEGKSWLQWIGYRGSPKENFPFHPKGKRLRLLPVVMEPKLIERIDPCPGIADPKRAPEFFVKDPDGVTFKKFCLVFKWSKPYFSALIEARRDGRAPGIRSVSLKGDWNELFDKHMHGERIRQYTNQRTGYSKSERYAAGRHDFADCKKMDCAHAMRRGYLIPAEITGEHSREP